MSKYHLCQMCNNSKVAARNVEYWGFGSDEYPDEPQVVICKQCVADAKLGRMVRAMNCGLLLHFRWTPEIKNGWSVEEYFQGEPRSIASGDTPEQALEKAMGEGK